MEFGLMECRPGCGACCIAISISSPLPGHPFGKLAGVRCINLTPDNKCNIHDSADYPRVCRNLKPSGEMCGTSFTDAYTYLEALENNTRP